MLTKARWLVCVACAGLLFNSACGVIPWIFGDPEMSSVVPERKPPSGEYHTYTVQGGDTLYAISKLHDMHYTEIAAFNGIISPYVIRIGEIIYVPITANTHGSSPTRSTRRGDNQSEQSSVVPSAITTAKTASLIPLPQRSKTYEGWQWPVSSSPIRDQKRMNKGLDYVLPDNETIHAATDGTVVYTGTGLNNYKSMLILDTGTGYLIAYEFNVDIDVEADSRLKRGDAIAKVVKPIAGAATTRTRYNHFHFEIWREGSPYDPRTVIGEP